MKISNAAHKKNVQSVKGSTQQIIAINSINANAGTTNINSNIRHISMTPDRLNNNSNLVFVAAQSIHGSSVENQKQNQLHPQNQLNQREAVYNTQSVIPLKQKQVAGSQPRVNFVVKQKNYSNAGFLQQVTAIGGIRESAQQLPNMESIQQLSVAGIIGSRAQPSPGAFQQVQLLNQNNSSIDDILAQQAFAKNYNNSTALIGSSRKAQKIQIHMKNNRFHNRKASGPATLSNGALAGTNLTNKQFLIQHQQNVSQERITNYESSIQQMSQQFFDGQIHSNNITVSNQLSNGQTRSSSRGGGRLSSGNVANQIQPNSTSSNGTGNRPGSQNRRKDKLVNQFGRTFFHPPGGVSNAGFEQVQNGPTLIDHNQILNQQFNTTTGQLSQLGMANVRAGIQLEMQKQDSNTAANKSKQYKTRKEGSQDRSAIQFQKPVGQFDLPSSKHAKSKSQNKFSQPELTRYNNSIEQIAENLNITMQPVTSAINNKEKRQNHSIQGIPQQVQIKQNLQKGTKIDIMMNSAYNIKNNNRKQQMKGTQHIQKKMLSGISFPGSLNQTQSVRFQDSNIGSAVPSIQTFNTGPILQTTSQSGMSEMPSMKRAFYNRARADRMLISQDKSIDNLQQVDKGSKNSFYLKQQINNTRTKQHSKDRSNLTKGAPMVVQEEGGQHRKNHSAVIDRAEILRIDANKQRQVDASPDRIGMSNKALKLPGMHSDQGQLQSQGNMIADHQLNNNYAAPTEYFKNLNQSATNANTRALKKKGSASSIERQNKQGGAMTPSIERGSIHSKGIIQGQPIIKVQDNIDQHYPGSSGNKNNPQLFNASKQVMVTDGGTGASLKRVFIQQESTHTSQGDSQSNYGSTSHHHAQSYHLPIKSTGSSYGFSSKQSQQQKRIQMQKVNAQKFNKAAISNYQMPALNQENLSETASVTKNGTLISNSDLPGNQSINSSYKTNFEQHQKQTVVTRGQQKLRTESRKDNRGIKIGSDYNNDLTDQDDGHNQSGSRRSISINITEEALRLGKLPTEQVAKNIANNMYKANGVLRNNANGVVSPRVIEIVDISSKIKNSFEESGEAPLTNTEFYRAGKMLGRGAFGKVNLGMQKLTRKLIAIKSINQEYLTDDKQRTKIMHEVGILLRLRHQSVVKLYETFETKRHIMLVMELCAGGDLLNFVRKRKKCDEPLAKVLFKQIIEGIGYIHSKSILHRDIKLDNILLDGKGEVKIADFGVSKTVKPGETMYEQSGTPAYIAPEIIKNEGYKGFKADLWSAGVVLFALLFGTVPFKANNMKDLHQQILQAKYNMKEDVSENAKNLIRGLLCTNPKKRLSVRQVLEHPWLVGAELLSRDIFNETEKEVIRSEFTYNDPSRFNRNERINQLEEPWDCFTELNLDSMNQTLRNASEKSLILAPFNSTMSDLSGFFRSVLAMAPMEEKKEVLKFAARCRDQDRQYEINNNAELDNGVYHKFVYSTKDSKAEAGGNKPALKKRDQEGEGALLSRNSSTQNLDKPTFKDDSEDLTKARDKGGHMDKQHLKAEREALKADIRRLKGGKKSNAQGSNQSSESEDELANTIASNFSIALDDDRVQTLVHFGYPIDYVKYTILENESNYCCTAYYLLGTDQNY